MLAGYSYKSSQYGLAIDNVAGYELVLPNGTIKHVTQKDKDIWFGLRVSSQGLIQASDADFEWTLIAGRAQ
jgi:FAD/FMN-containing dehydrogenase